MLSRCDLIVIAQAPKESKGPRVGRNRVRRSWIYQFDYNGLVGRAPLLFNFLNDLLEATKEIKFFHFCGPGLTAKEPAPAKPSPAQPTSPAIEQA